MSQQDNVDPLSDSRSTEGPRILLLEASPEQAELFREALVLASRSLEGGGEVSPHGIEVRSIAQDALNSLRKRAEAETGGLPELVVLDLDLPARASLTFLRELRRNPGLAGLPVIVMTRSDEPAIRRALYGFGVVGYLIKPLRFSDLLIMMGDIFRTWRPVDRRRELCLLEGERHT